jgi:hypothetical protein
MGAATLPLAVLAVLATACGGGTTAPATGATPKPTPGTPRNVVRGEVVKIADNVVTVTDSAGTDAHFDLTPTTVVSQEQDAQATDATVGTCAFGIGERVDTDLVSAQRMIITDHGPKGPDDCRRGSGGGIHHLGVAGGLITAIAGDTYTVSSNAGPQRFKVMSQTKVTRLVKAAVSNLNTGECVTARGQRNGSGDIIASNVVITPSAVGSCFVNGGRGSLGSGSTGGGG